MERRQHPRPDEASPDRLAGPVENISLDVIYDILRNERRRLVLHHLVNKPSHQAVIGTLATQIAAWENDIPVSAVSSVLRKRTYNTLQQTHLPKMDEAGLLTYDRHRGDVELAVSPRQLDVFLGLLPKTTNSRLKAFIAVGFGIWLVLALNWIAVHALELYASGTTSVLTGISLLLVLTGFGFFFRAWD